MSRRTSRPLDAAWQVFCKEWRDALRDRRTLAVVLLSSVLMGPLLLLALSALLADLETRADAREVWAVGLDTAPTLRNYLERQAWTVQRAPDGFEAGLKDRSFGHAVLRVPERFEADLAAGQVPTVAVVSASGNTRASAEAGGLHRLLRGFSQEQGQLRLVLHGVAPGLLQVLEVDEQDLSDARVRAAQLTRMLPFFVLMAVLYGAMHAALDTTAGERERGSLEPLLMTPAPRLALVLGKWAAVAGVGMAVAVLCCASFLPGQWLLRSQTLAAMFQFGLHEAARFCALLLPLAALLSALLMAVAIRCRSVKQAQASSAVLVMAVSLLPLLTLFNPGAEQPWQLWLPALAQVTLMQRVLEGDPLPLADLLPPLGVALGLTVLCLAWVARRLRAAALA